MRVEATGVSFAEQQMRRGKYYDQPKFPFVPGYDLVGTVGGRRVAALTKVGGWADHVVLDEADLVDVPDGVSAEAAETVVVNGLTAYRMLFRVAKVKRGETIVVHGANGGVGSVLVQLALHAGIRVIGTAGPGGQEHLRALGVSAIDYRSENVLARVRELAPGGVAAVFDHVGGPGIDDSWAMGGTLVSYGTAATRDVPGNPRAAGAEAAGQADGLEPAAKRPQGALLQPLGRAPLQARAVPRAAARGPDEGVRARPRRCDHAADRRALPAQRGGRGDALRRGRRLHGEGAAAA